MNNPILAIIGLLLGIIGLFIITVRATGWMAWDLFRQKKHEPDEHEGEGIG